MESNCVVRNGEFSSSANIHWKGKILHDLPSTQAKLFKNFNT